MMLSVAMNIGQWMGVGLSGGISAYLPGRSRGWHGLWCVGGVVGRVSACVLAWFLWVGLTGCRDEASGGRESGVAPGGYRVVATVGMIADVVRQVAGDRAEVVGIIGEGVDPHLYKPTTADVKALQAADVVFYNGLMLEGRMADVLERMKRAGKPVFAVAEAILEGDDYVLAEGDPHADPHVWMDVGGWMRVTRGVAGALSAFDGGNAGVYAENAERYLEELAGLDAYAKEALGSIPQSRRVLVTAHDAFNYMARAYGLEVKGIQGISTESEAGVKDIERLVDFLVERRIPAVFVESSVSEKNVRALIEGAGARGHEVFVGGELFSDAMGASGTYEGTYVGMIDHNITTIARALGGTAPERGLNGRLAPSVPQR